MPYDVHVHIDLAHPTVAPYKTDVTPMQNQHAGGVAAPAPDDGAMRPYDGGPS
jgi:hypothetical protein